MKVTRLFINFSGTFALLLSACSVVSNTSMTQETQAITTEIPTVIAEVSSITPEPMPDLPAWFSTSLTDARTGQTFSVTSFKGKVILVETIAVWCSKCLTQQRQVAALHETLGERDDFVSIGLDIDPNENVAQLKNYVETNGFNWLYAISPLDVSREISSLYGDQFLNPPSTPIVVIDRHGIAHPTSFGIKSVEDLLKFIQPYLDESI